MPSFIADRIRIDKAGNVTTTADPTPATPTPIWTQRQLLAELVELANHVSLDTAKLRISTYLVVHKADAQMVTLLNWMDRNWDISSHEKKVYVLVEWYSRRAP